MRSKPHRPPHPLPQSRRKILHRRRLPLGKGPEGGLVEEGGGHRSDFRALEFQFIESQLGQGKLIQTVHGCVWDVLVDLRPQSATFKQYFSITLSNETPTQVYAPDGFVHGFCVLSEMAIMHYKCTTFHDKTKEFGLRWNDPAFDINWPNQSFILSDKDAHQPLFNHELQA